MSDLPQTVQTIRTSEKIDLFAAALSAAQGEMGTAKRSQYNDQLKTHYADLASVRDVYQKPFANHGLAIVQVPNPTAKGVSVTTRIVHSSGQWMEGTLEACPKDPSPQVVGLIVTYLRRIAASAMAGVVAAGEDGDGGATTEAATPAQGTPQAAQEASKDAPAANASATLSEADLKALESSYKKALAAVNGAKSMKDLNNFISVIAKRPYSDKQKETLHEAIAKKGPELTGT